MDILLLFFAIVVASVLFYLLNRHLPRDSAPTSTLGDLPNRKRTHYGSPGEAFTSSQTDPPSIHSLFNQQTTNQEGTTMSYNPNQISYTPPQQAKTNTLAIVSLVSAFLISIVAVITGHMALKQIEQTGEQGRGLALAGLILGYIGLAVGLIYFIVAMSSLAALSSY